MDHAEEKGRRWRGWVVGLASLGLLAIPACGSSEFLHAVHPASGLVTYQGKPVDRATVTFHPASPEAVAVPKGKEGPEVASPTTQTDAEGKYTMSTYLADDGLPAGDYKVTVVWAPQILAVGTGEELSDDDKASGEFGPVRRNQRDKDKLGGKYANPATTTLKATVEPGKANVFPLELN